MSRLLLDAPKDLLVDHRNGNTLDNRRSNLRLATHSQNSVNALARGVFRDRGSWRACVGKDRKRYYKSFKTEADAIKWRREKLLELFGEFGT